MKFLCDQCKAKYQISDEKIAGKTVRMKCRKCGHQIEVRAAVTESSVSQGLPKPDRPVETVKTPFGSAPRPPAPRAGGLATSLSAAKPPPPRPGAPGALANAFNRSVQKDEQASALELLELSAADEWYVAINSVPVGPIRIGELRRKAASGAVTDDSLVWQEGMEEWRPVKSLPDLAAVVREAAAGGRVSLVTPPPGEARGSQPPPAPRAPSHTPPPGTALQRLAKPAGSSPAVGAPATARSNVVPITSRLATAERLDSAPQMAPMPMMATPDPFAVPPAPAPAQPMQHSASSPLLAAPQLGPYAPSIPPPEPARRSPPWMAIAMIALAVAFGVTAGIVVFMNNKQPPPQPVVIQVPAVQTAPTTTATPTATAPTTAETPTAPTSTGTTSRPIAAAGGPRTPGTGSAKGNAADLTSLLGGAGGPTQGPTGAGGTGSGGSSLTSDQVQAVVRNRSAGVKRTCWERGSADKAGTVSVRVSLGVNGSGQVTDASASGPDPVMNKCIENQVRTWQFPPTGGTSRVEIPFHFVAQ